MVEERKALRVWLGISGKVVKKKKKSLIKFNKRYHYIIIDKKKKTMYFLYYFIKISFKIRLFFPLFPVLFYKNVLLN